MMRRLRNPWTRALLVWTAVLLAAATILAIGAVAGFLRSADDCYFQVGPCSQAGDPDVVRLQFAVFGIPLIWLVGVLVGVVGRMRAGRRGTEAP